MDRCMLPATGFDPAIVVFLGIAVLVLGVTALAIARRRIRVSVLLVPVIVLAVLAGGQAAPSSASAATACPPAGSAPAPGGGVAPGVVFTAGAAGIGDPYYPLDGNGGYDVRDYGLDLAYDPASGVLSGTAAITLVATQNLSSLNLDFDTRAADGSDRIVVSAARVDGIVASTVLTTTPISADTAQPLPAGSADAGAEPPRTELTVTPAAGILSGTQVVVEVDYAGVPITIDDAFGAAGVFATADGMVISGEPRVAATWFPSNDHPSDKATMTMSMAVPSGLEVIGNGVLQPTTTAGTTTTWTYVMDRPMATYLATATVGEYDVVTTVVDGVTYRDAVAQSLFAAGTAGAESRAAFAINPTAVSYLSGIFGPYPFTESGGIAADVADLGFALENQTRPIYPGVPDESTIVHELAHQWYGDDVAISTWADIWLNEGFATYAEWLWSEQQGGTTAQQTFDDLFATDAADPFWTVEVADPGAVAIFDDPVYLRGAMTLHALRVEVGDTTFFEILRGWAAENSGGNVTTGQFEEYASSVAGTDLTALFDTWLHTPSKP